MARCRLAGAALLALAGCHRPAEPPAVETPALKQVPMAELRQMLKGYPGEWRPDSDRHQQRPEPPAEKPVPEGARRIALVPIGEIKTGRLSVREAIAARRSVRDFTDAALSLEELSYLLWATQGVTGTRREEDGTTLQFRAAPSAVGRYPLETYLAITRVEG